MVIPRYLSIDRDHGRTPSLSPCGEDDRSPARGERMIAISTYTTKTVIPTVALMFSGLGNPARPYPSSTA